MTLGFIGLGKMGSRMAVKLLKEDHGVVVWNRSPEPVQELKAHLSPEGESSNLKTTTPHFTKASRGKQNLKIAETIRKLIESLLKPRVIWSMVSAGEATQRVLDEVSKFTQEGDIVIDGGNSFYKDTQGRFEDFRAKGVRFLGIGVSGGIIAAEEGYPMMVGGDKSAYEFIKPILAALAKPHGGHDYFGEGGAGHFVKMIHNGIEYGIMQSLGEGFEVLEKAPYDLDLLKVARLYQKGTLVSGFMLDRLVEVLSNPSILASIEGRIAESGEAKWTIEQAKEEKVEVEIIERSLAFRRRSQTDFAVQNSFTAKLVAALRNAFGGHPIRQGQGKEVKKK